MTNETQAMSGHTARCNSPIRCRSGATIVEAAIVLPVLLIALFALLDLGIAALRYNALADASRSIARQVIIHGSLAPAGSATWGPDEFVGTAADSSDFVASIQGLLPTMQNNDVTVQITWLDKDNSPRDRVRVETSFVHEPLISGLSLWGSLDLHSVATMHIVN